jgi:hypothetical protein
MGLVAGEAVGVVGEFSRTAFGLSSDVGARLRRADDRLHFAPFGQHSPTTPTASPLSHEQLLKTTASSGLESTTPPFNSAPVDYWASDLRG